MGLCGATSQDQGKACIAVPSRSASSRYCKG